MIQFATIIAARGRRQRCSSFLHGRLRCHKINIYNNINSNIIIKSDNITAKGSSSSWRCRCVELLLPLLLLLLLSLLPSHFQQPLSNMATLLRGWWCWGKGGWGHAVPVYPVLCAHVWFYSLICGWWLLSNCFTFAFRIGDALRYTKQQG